MPNLVIEKAELPSVYNHCWAVYLKQEILYVEQKTGFDSKRPAWIGKGAFSKSGRTIYFNDQAFRSSNSAGVAGNYYNIETGDEYWISGVKKNQQDRHWSESGIAMIDEAVVPEYLSIIGAEKLSPSRYKVVSFIEGDVVSRIQQLENQKTV
jgi:hypothetical protein